MTAVQKSKQAKRALTPRLRFPGFREAGEWSKPKLDSLGTFTGGGTPSKDNSGYWEGMNPWVSSSDISDDSIYEIKINRFISDQAIQETAAKVVPENSILLVSRVGVGKLAITKDKICTSQDFTNFTPAKDNLVFLAYSLKAMKDKFLSFNQGMAIQGFTKDDVSNLKIPLPVEPREQQKIAACLSSLDDLIAAGSRRLDALKTHKKGLMQQLFPREGETTPRLRFPEFRDAGEWKQRELGELCLIGDIDHRMPESVDTGVPYIMTGDFVGINGIDFNNAKMISIQDYEQLSLKIKPEMGDIIFARYASVGAVRYIETTEKFLVSYSCAILKPNGEVNGNWLFYHLQSNECQRQIELNINAGSQRNIGIDSLKKLVIFLPAKKEQNFISNLFSNLDHLIVAQTQKIDALKTHKTGLMQQLFPAPDAVTE